MSSPRTGLVFSGGGAKGAYQIGCWRALHDAGIKVDSVSGSSVGALNASLYLTGNIESAESCWTEISSNDVHKIDLVALTAKFLPLLIGAIPIMPFAKLKLAAGVKAVAATLLGLVKAGALAKALVREGILNVDPLRNLIDRHIDFNQIRKEATRLYVTTYATNPFFTLVQGYTHYHLAQRIHPYAMREIILASAAIPIAFPAVKVGAAPMVDGGVGDNTPIKPLYNEGCERIFVIYLQQKPKRDYRPYEDAELIPIIPSKDLGGMLEFDSAQARGNIKQGYDDTASTLMDHRLG